MTFIQKWVGAYGITELCPRASAELFVQYLALICQQRDLAAADLLEQASEKADSVDGLVSATLY